MNERNKNRKSAASRIKPLSWILIAFSLLAAVSALVFGLLYLSPSNGELEEKIRPEQAGLSSKKMAECVDTILADGMRVHSLFLARKGNIVIDAYFEPYFGATYHKLASVTKSVTGTLIGIARDEGLLKLDDSLLSFFPERKVDDPEGLKKLITVRDLLTMRSGFEGNPYDDESELAKARATRDWVRYALDRPMSSRPGTRFIYAGLDSHLLSAIVTRVTGKSALDYAREKLFAPLGIREVFWDTDPQGNNRGWGDLCLYPRDMAKIGQLYLNDGVWKGARLLSREWIGEATKRQIRTPGYFPEDYGYHMRVSKENEVYRYFEASGNGEQKIRMYPDIGVLIVTTGAGFDFGKLGGMIGAAFLSPKAPLPRAREGERALEAAIERAATPHDKKIAVVLPEVAARIDGLLYQFAPNPLALDAVSIRFPSAEEARFDYRYAGEETFRQAVIGLDGVARTSVSGLPLYLRGAWVGDEAFEIEWSEGPAMNIIRIRLKFRGRAVRFVADAGFGAPVEIDGRAQ